MYFYTSCKAISLRKAWKVCSQFECITFHSLELESGSFHVHPIILYPLYLWDVLNAYVSLTKRSLFYISRENCMNFIKTCWLLFLFQPPYQNSKCTPMCVWMDITGKPRNKLCFYFLISFISFLYIYPSDIFFVKICFLWVFTHLYSRNCSTLSF